MANDDLKPELREQIQKGGGEHSLFPRIMLSLLESAEKAEAGRAELAGQIAEREQSAGKQTAEVLEAIQKSNQEAAERHAKTQKTIALFGVLSLVAILAAAAAFFFVQK